MRAGDGREALARAQETRPEAVISDVLMPLMDGYELARRLKADPATANSALMFYTRPPTSAARTHRPWPRRTA